MKRNLLFFLSLWALCAFTTTAVAEEVDYTSSIVNADLSTTDAWNTDGTKGISGGVVKVGSGSSFDFSQTITIPAGHYKMTAKAAYRYGANEQEEYDAIQAGANTHLAKLYAQTAAQTFEANVFNRYEGASETDYAAGSGSVTVNGLFVPNSSAAVQAWFEAGQYVNVLEFDVLEDGDVKIGIVKTESAASGDYANIGAWTLTRTGDAQNTGEGEGEGEGDDTNTIDVDKTSLVGTSRDAWQGNNGGPVTIDGISLPEKYETTTATLGDVMWQTVEGLDNGTYTVELYANARYTPGRGFNSDATDGALDFTYLYANNVEISIPVYHNGDLNNGQSYTLEGVEVTDGTLKMGMTKKAAGSNWHTIQIKSLTWHTSGDAALTDAKNALQALIDETKAVSPAIESLTEAIATAEAALAAATTVEEVEAAQTALQAAYDAAADQIAYNKNVASVAGASVDNPIVTNFVVNGTFDTNGVVSPWKTTTGAQNQTTATNQKGAFTGNFFENWNPSAYTGKIYQEIKNIPNGVYELSICAFVSVFDASCQYVYGNDAKTYLTTGAPTAYKVVFEVTDNTAEIGFEQTVAKAEWSGIDNVSLTYYGAEASVNDVLFGSYIKTVEELRATATDLLTKVNDATKATLETALAGTETIESTIEAYEAAIATLNTAINAAKPNADVKAAIDNYYDLMASTNVYTQEAYNTFKAIADAYLAKWEANELTEPVVNPYAIQGWHAEVNYDDFLLSAWGTNNFDTNLYINTWSGEGENDGSNFKVPFFEYWTGDDQSLGATTKTATITGLTPGAVYKVSAWVRVRLKNNAAAPTYGITLSVGADGTPVDVAAGTQVGASPFYIGEYTATGTTDANGTLTINFNVAADNNISWLSFKNVKYAGPSNLDFSQSTPIDNHICTYAKDVTGNGTTYSQMQPVTSWDMGVANGDARAAGVFAYGSNLWLGSAGNYVPATNPEGVAEGNALGAVAVWDAVAQYTQNVTLLPGTYNLMVPVYKASAGATAPQKSLIGFIAENGTEYLAPAKNYTQGAWTYEIVTFTLDEKTSGVLSLGYDATNAGSGAQQALFIDGVQFVADSYIPVANLKTAISAAQATANAASVGEAFLQVPTSALDTYNAAIAAAQATADNAEATAEELAAAVETLAAATAAFVATPVNGPDTEKAYQFKLNVEGDVYMNLDNGVRIEAEATPISFVPADVEGQYYLVSGEAYVGLDGGNTWTMSTSADKKAAWTFTLIGDGLYRINNIVTTGRFVGTNAADIVAGSPVYADKKTDNGNINWIIEEYVEPPFAVTLVNPAEGTTKLEEGDFIQFTTNKDAEVGFINVGVLQVSDEDPTNTEYLASYRSAVKGESDWSVELFSTMKFRQGYTYKFEFTAYENEDAYNQAPGSAAIGTDTIAFAGTLPAYVYATATLNTITPDYGAIIENEADSIVTLTFSEPVKVVYAQTAKSEGRFMPPTLIDLVPVAVEADENGLATVWTVAMPLLPGFANISFAAEDAEGRRVWGNQGEEETSYFSYEWQCTVGIPEITIAPEGEVEGPVSTITVSSEVQIDPYMWNGGVYDAEGNLVAEFESLDKIVDESLEMWTDEWNAAMATAPVTVTLSAEITEPGTYTVKFEAGSFMLDNAYNSKATEATFTIVKNEQVGINGIAADDVVETKYFGVNGAALDAPVKGINIVKQTLKDGKVVTSKVYVK